MAKSADLSDIDYVITDKMPPDPLKASLIKANCKILTP
jgi:DeoR/GlpR family transcriptional regulator of sugar metabolism